MNGIHDMGGMHGMGPIVREQNEPVFHAQWEKRVFALNIAAGALSRWNIDMSRYAREQMPAAEYLAASYYEQALFSLQKRINDRLLTGDAPSVSPLRAEQVAEFIARVGTARSCDHIQPKFRLGERVRARNINPATHTRIPRYVRGRQGVIERDHGAFIFPDTNALGLGENPQHVYAVRFAAQELWGPEASPRDCIFVDLWDDYLVPI